MGTPRRLNPCDIDLSFLQSVVGKIIKEEEQQKSLLVRINTVLRRALRKPQLRDNPHEFPPDAIGLCVVAHLTGISVDTVHSHYSAVSTSDKDLILLEELKRVYSNGWTPLVSNTDPSPSCSTPSYSPSDQTKPSPVSTKQASVSKEVGTPETPKTSHISDFPRSELKRNGIFVNHRVFLVPSPLFSRRAASTLCSRIVETGGDACVVNPGIGGLEQVNAEIQATEKDCNLKGTNDCERSVVVTDQALARRRSDAFSHLEVLPPRWISDSLRSSRLKPVSLYAISSPSPSPPLKANPEFTPPTVAALPCQSTLTPTRKRTLPPQPSLTDFRAEFNFTTHDDIDSNTPAKRARRDVFHSVDKLSVATRLFASPTLDRNDRPRSHQIHAIQTHSISVESREYENIDEAKEVTKGSPQSRHKTENDQAPKKYEKEDGYERQRGPRWACEVRVGISDSDFPTNDRICDLLSIVQAACDAKRDAFRALGYQKAISRIRTLDYEILSAGDVRRVGTEPNVGTRMAAKIGEIVTTGRLRQADAVLQDASYQAVRILCGVWGIGPAKAMSLVANNVHSIEALRAAAKINPHLLDRCQTIGLRRYEDLATRMPRAYIAELEIYIRRTVKQIDTSIGITIAGSYLRGKATCGDVDILVHGDARRVRNAFPKIQETMRKAGVLTDDLVEGDGKYFGVFRLPGRPHGRIDLFAVPQEQYPFALLTYTGSAVFNRSMRAKAKALGYSLSHRALQKVTRTKQGKTRLEPPIVVKNEKEVFLMLDIPYVPPSDRSIS